MEWYKGKEWTCEEYGISKKVLDIDFKKLEKPFEIAEVVIVVDDVKNLNERPSKYLGDEGLMGKEQIMIMGTALTPVDMNLEILVREMNVGERSLITIKTRKNPEASITCVVKLIKIISTQETYKLNVKEVYELALKYKENGVAMYKEYPAFGSQYFEKALLLLISLKPFKGLEEKKPQHGINKDDIKSLFNQLRLNLAANHLQNKRYEDVIYLTKFIEKQDQPSEKAVYRRSLAFFNIKEYEKAIKVLEKVPNYMEKKDFASLHGKITKNWQASNENYKTMVKKMFG